MKSKVVSVGLPHFLQKCTPNSELELKTEMKSLHTKSFTFVSAKTSIKFCITLAVLKETTVTGCLMSTSNALRTLVLW